MRLRSRRRHSGSCCRRPTHPGSPRAKGTLAGRSARVQTSARKPVALVTFGPRVERRHRHAVVAAAFVALHIAAFSAWAVIGTSGSYFGGGATGAIVDLAATAVVGALRAGAWRYAAVAAVLGAWWWWWPHGGTSSDQVHLGGAIAGACFGVLRRMALDLVQRDCRGGAAPSWPSPTRRRFDHRTGCRVQPAGTTRRPPSPPTLYGENDREESADVYWMRADGTRDFLAELARGRLPHRTLLGRRSFRRDH